MLTTRPLEHSDSDTHGRPVFLLCQDNHTREYENTKFCRHIVLTVRQNQSQNYSSHVKLPSASRGLLTSRSPRGTNISWIRTRACKPRPAAAWTSTANGRISAKSCFYSFSQTPSRTVRSEFQNITSYFFHLPQTKQVGPSCVNIVRHLSECQGDRKKVEKGRRNGRTVEKLDRVTKSFNGPVHGILLCATETFVSYCDS